jgi:lipopolysaccharide export system protein LptA
VWTPRRVLLLILGVVLFGTAFGVYARFLGWIDGLPELPEELLARRADNEPLPALSVSPVEARLQQAFGPGCVEATRAYSIQLDIRARGMVLAAGSFGFDAEGRVKLWPFSLARFKEKPGQFPEITTVHCSVAFLEFDRPVRSAAEIGDNRRIVGFQLESDPNELSDDPRRGKIIVFNNRATPTADDDLVLETPGPVYYREAANLDLALEKRVPQLRTAAAVRIVDHKHQPDATTIDAQGMEVYLAGDPPEQPGSPARRPKPHGSAVSGVRRVVLPANVRMNLWLDPKDGFLTTGVKPQPAKPAPAANKPAEPNHVLITTLGRFAYDVLPDGDRARFDRLPPAASALPDCVRVVRPIVRGPDATFNDQLECDTLEMQFAHKDLPVAPGPAARAAAPAGNPLASRPAGKDEDHPAINWAHAWGQFVVVTSDEEKLEARGNDLYYDARTKATTLKGVPEMVAVKDGHEIHAPELVMYGTEAKDGRHAEARGAGHFRFVDRAGTKRTVEARWRDLMTYRQDDGRDLLTLTGDAVFEDRESGQLLRADLLKLLLAPDPKPPTSEAKPTADAGAPKLRPQRLEATGHVRAKSPDLTVPYAEELVLLFKDVPPAPATSQPAPAGSSPWTSPLGPGPPPGAAAAPGRPAQQPPPKKPIDVTARTIQAFIVRQGEVSQLDVVHCEDNVRVHQDPVPPQEKPVDMRGRALQLNHLPQGNILKVTGTLASPGEVHLPDLSLLGPFIVINQVENTAEVQGLGSMRMVSTTDFEGKKLAEPTPLVVTWKQQMRFTGKQAMFVGAVQADQDHTTVLCETMQVDLNRPVSLNPKAGDPRQGRDAANVDRVVCDAGGRPQGVIIIDTVRENGRLMSRRQIEADAVQVYKDEGKMDVSNHGTNRGNVRIVQLGPKGEPTGGPARPGDKRPAPNSPTKQTEQEYKLTWVRYNGTMKVNNQERMVYFYNGVELLHLPVETPDQQPAFDATVNKLPSGALYLRSIKMTVYSGKDAQGQTRQQMEATGKANVTWGNEFFGSADVIKFDEAKQELKLEGLNGGLARARRFNPQGGDRGDIVGRKIIYNRATDTFSGDGVYSGHGTP